MKTMMKASVVLLVLFGLCIPLHGQVAARQPEATSTISSLLVTAQAARDHIRFTALTVGSRMRLEILSQTGDTLYDSSFQPGNLIEWALIEQQGPRLPDGVYGCIVTVEELSGRATYRRGLFRLSNGKVSFDALDPSQLVTAAVNEVQESISILGRDDRFPFTFVGHDGTDARIESTAGGLIFHAGRFFAGESGQSPHIRLTPDGNLGIGVREPAAKLDVAGLIRTSEGIQFPDGSILKSANGFGSFSIFPSSRKGILPDSGPSTAGMGFGPSGRAFDTSRLSKAASGVKQMTAAGGGIGRVYGTEGPSNTFYGLGAGSSTTGDCNSFFGVSAGHSNTTESNNTFVGASPNGATGITNATAIGYLAEVTQSNSLILGGVNGVNGATAETNVGIGVTNPDRQLTVEGSQALGRFRRYYGTADPFTATFAPAFLFERARGTQASPSDMLPGDYLGKMQFGGRVGGNYPGYGALAFIASDTAQNGRFAFLDRDIATERVSILNTGNVGIGTTTPTERLHVVGNIRVTGTITYGAPETDVPDYVFDPNCKLMTPEDLGKFVAREKHLPNVLAASEMKEKGLNLSEFQMKLLEKIEELTLYTVQQERTIREQHQADEAKAARISTLEAKNSTLEAKVARISTLEAKNSALEARLAAIEQMLLRQQDHQQK